MPAPRTTRPRTAAAIRHRRRRPRRRGEAAEPPGLAQPPRQALSRGSTRSPGGCAPSAHGTESRTSARSSLTPSRSPTSLRMPLSAGTTPSCSTSSATSSSRSTSSRCCWRSERRATGPGSRARAEKLIRRHPHVFGEVAARPPARCFATGIGSSRRRPAASRALRRGAGEPARAAVRAKGPAAGCIRRIRLGPSARSTPMEELDELRPRSVATRVPAGSATCCFATSRWRAS